MKSVGIDTGGTFTDVAVYDPHAESITVRKVPSTPDRPDEGVFHALESAALQPEDIERLVHGTTIATNVLLERRGAKLALIMTEGFRDTLEIGRTRRAEPGLFNTKATRPAPLVPRAARFEVEERVLADGTVLRPLDPASVDCALDGIGRLAPDAVVVCLLHSYANPDHERQVQTLVAQRFPDLSVQLSSDILPEYREYERLTTAVLNAYLLPSMAGYLTRLSERLDLNRRRLFVMGSNGGAMTAATAAKEPARTFLSGPAGGVQGAIMIGRVVGFDELITCDMGGTSTDVCFLRGLSPGIVHETMIAGLPLKLPQLEINTVGAGGGSIAAVDVAGTLSVGPQSAGAFPGPACYGRGGRAVTVTDASLHLGRLGAGTVLASGLRLDVERAAAALGRLAQEARFADVDRLADGVLKLAVARMVSAVREISTERGYDPRRATLVPMGGAGPMYGAQVAEELAIQRILVPPHPGNMSAIGLLAADIRHELAQTWIIDLPDLEAADFAARLDSLRGKALALLERDGFAAERCSLEPAVDLRYRGQAFELTVPLGDAFDLAALRQRFESLYERRYRFRPEGRTPEIVALRMLARGKGKGVHFSEVGRHPDGPETAQKGARRVYFEDRWHAACPVYERERLGAGTALRGPAIIEEYGSTTVLPPGWGAEIDDWGNILMVRC